MYPTIHPYGEIILVDRLSPRLWGIDGGCVGTDRAREARKRQDSWEEMQRRSRSADVAAVGATSTITTDLYQWHEPRIPVNQLPPNGAWTRFWKQLTTGISVGDVVVVQHPDRRGTVCKRILGLPGDMVVDPPSSEVRRNRNKRRVFEHGLLVIPDGHIWIEGDNPRNSADSRNYGPVPAAMIVGRVVCRVWPLRGSAMLQRGARPCPPEGAPFAGSTILPAGYEGEEIVKVSNEDFHKHRSNKNQGPSWTR
jgi:signal peptidase I